MASSVSSTDLAPAERRPPLPRFAQIEPTGLCNLACPMCTVNHRADAPRHLTLARFQQWIEQLLHLQGLGEPMLNPEFFEMVAWASARGIRVSANTNLTLLTPERAQRCIDSGLHALSVSVDAADREVYESIRVKASYDKVVRNLGRLSAVLRRAAGAGPQVRLVMVLMRRTLDQLAPVLRLAQRFGVHTVQVQRLSSDLEQADLPARYIPIRDHVRDAELSPADLVHARAAFAQASRLAAALGVTLHLPRLSPNPQPPRCTWPWEQLYLTAGGEMLPCCMAGTPDRASFGNVQDEYVLTRWHGEAAQRFREQLAGSEPPQLCRHCALYHGAF